MLFYILINNIKSNLVLFPNFLKDNLNQPQLQLKRNLSINYISLSDQRTILLVIFVLTQNFVLLTIKF